MSSHVAFQHGRHLLQMLEVLLDPAEAFPKNVGRTDGKWVVPQSLFGGTSALEVKRTKEAARSLRIPIDYVGEPKTSVPLVRALRQTWIRCDPVAASWGSPEPAATLLAQGGTPGQVRSSRTRYVLACAEEEMADEVLQLLTGFLTVGIEATPLVPERLPHGSKWRYFWSVCGRPPIAVLRAADRVWWGPDQQYGSCQFYFEWPYQCPWPKKVLERLSWGASGSLVLIGPSDPEVLGLEWNGPLFGPLCDHVDLKITSQDTLPTLQPSPQKVRFPVHLELVECAVADTDYRDRALQTQQQIDYLQHLLKWLREMQRDTRPVDAGYQPLYIYEDRTGDQTVPYKLQQLMIEWSDHDTELGRLYYQKIFSQALDPEAPLGAVSHVLTTDEALGLTPPEMKPVRTLAARLHRYRPEGRGPFSHFVLLPEWNQFGLRVFVPYRDSTKRWKFRMNPVLPETEKSARILADSFGIKWGDRTRCVAVLTPDPHKGVRCRLIPIFDHDSQFGFRPLAKAFEWSCAIEAAPASAWTIERHGDEAANALAAGIGEKLNQAFDDRIQPIIDGLDQRFESFQALCEKQERHEARIMADLASLDSEQQELDRQLFRFGAQLSEIADEVGRPIEHAADIGNLLDQLDSVSRQGRELQQRVNALATRVEQLRSGDGES